MPLAGENMVLARTFRMSSSGCRSADGSGKLPIRACRAIIEGTKQPPEEAPGSAEAQ
jgi:hypothetical protein